MRKLLKNIKNLSKKGNKSSPASRSASPSPGTASVNIPVARTVSMEGSSVAQVQSVALGILGPALELFKEASVALPPLQAVVGSVFKCFEIYQTISGNTEKLKALANDLTSRTKFLQSILQKEGLEPSPLIQDLADDLEGICKKVIVSQDVGFIQKLQMDKNSQTIEGFQKEIQDAYEQCKMKLLFTIERNTETILRDIAKVLQPLVSAISKKELQGLKFFITSRPEPKIQAELNAYSASGMKEFILHNVEEDIVQNDISVYLQTEFQEISPEEEQLYLLTNLSQQLFIYAATVVRFVKEADGIARKRKRLRDCIENAANLKDLNALYVEILDMATGKLQDEEMQDDLNILHTIVSVGKPLTCQTIAELLHAEVESVSNLIHRLHAVFYMRETDGPIIIFHKSFYDFFFSFKDSKYKYNARTQHESLTFSCFQIMEKLCFNICDLPSSFIKDDDVPGFKDKVSKKIPETLNYCCQFWTDHFEIGQTDQLFQRVQKILIEKGIYWLEAMSLLKSLPRCSKMLDALKTSSNNADHSSIERIFINGDVYGMTPHLYLSIMPFWENGVGCKPQLWRGIKVINRVINWLPETTVTVNVSASVNSVQYSPMGDKIGTGCDDNAVRIWDARTGSQIGTNLSYLMMVNYYLHWTISEDGWIFFPHILPPIVWIPIALRKIPWTAKTQCIISSKGFTKFLLNDCVYGEDWVKCIL
ncbi:hypothetical protein EV359DRAFT_68863 [Lentinula novae-zelandiae]|nr:hypothetical protein EV359DRAFT_68863 [Lentinula novae-zelandiae]